MSKLGRLGAMGMLMVSAVLGTGITAAPASATPLTPPPGKIVIKVATVNGSGCPAGTTALAVSPDNTAFTVTYSKYNANVGPQSTATDFRKNCQLNLVVHVPQGYTFAIAQADYRGFASLQPGATAVQRANYYFQGSSRTDFSDHYFSGTLRDNWQTTDIVPVEALVWKPCGVDRNFNINTELRVDQGTANPNTTSFIAMDSTDGSINTIYNLAWKKC